MYLLKKKKKKSLHRSAPAQFKGQLYLAFTEKAEDP